MNNSTRAMILTSFETWRNENLDIQKTREEEELSNNLSILDVKLTAKEFIEFEGKMLDYVEAQNKIAYSAGFEACFKMMMDLK